MWLSPFILLSCPWFQLHLLGIRIRSFRFCSPRFRSLPCNHHIKKKNSTKFMKNILTVNKNVDNVSCDLHPFPVVQHQCDRTPLVKRARPVCRETRDTSLDGSLFSFLGKDGHRFILSAFPISVLSCVSSLFFTFYCASKIKIIFFCLEEKGRWGFYLIPLYHVPCMMCQKFWTFMWTEIEKNLLLLEGFFLCSEKLTFEKENVICKLKCDLIKIQKIFCEFCSYERSDLHVYSCMKYSSFLW